MKQNKTIKASKEDNMTKEARVNELNKQVRLSSRERKGKKGGWRAQDAEGRKWKQRGKMVCNADCKD